MEHLIDKDAVVAEIEKVRAKWFGINNDFADGQKGALTDVLSLINTLEVKEIGIDLGDPDGDKSAKSIVDTKTLEVKEVDLDEEVERFAKECGYKSAATIDFQFAKHFFELGLKTRQ